MSFFKQLVTPTQIFKRASTRVVMPLGPASSGSHCAVAPAVSPAGRKKPWVQLELFARCQDARADLFLLARHVTAHTDTHEPPLWFLKTFCTLLGEVFPPGANQAYLYY